MKILNILLISLLFYACASLAAVKKRYPDPKTKVSAKPKQPKIDIDLLPPLQELLETLGLTRFLKDFVKIGVTETRLLVRLSAMDFQLMSMDWNGITAEEIAKLKNEISALIIRATIPDEPITSPEVIERSKLTYGRVYMQDAIQSFEYVLGSFGGYPPIGRFSLQIPQDIYGCDYNSNEDHDFKGDVIAIMRGNCTFLTKAINAKKYNASAIIVVNTEDRLESPSSGLGVDKNITDAMVLSIGNMPILTFSNTSWAKLEYTVELNRAAGLSTYINMVPLKCKTGGICAPLLEEEKIIQDEVTWGTIRARSSSSSSSGSTTGSVQVRSFDFLTANFGGQLPTRGEIEVVLAEPLHACTELVPISNSINNNESVDINPDSTTSTSTTTSVDTEISTLANNNNKYTNKAVLIHRGQCRFDTKILNAQLANARLAIIIDIDDNPLQRMGGMPPYAGYIKIPSILITSNAGKFLQKQLINHNNNSNIDNNMKVPTVTIEILPSKNSKGSDAWINLAFTEWNKEKSELILQLDNLIQKYITIQNEDNSANYSNEIIAWLKRRLKVIMEDGKKSIDTDK